MTLKAPFPWFGGKSRATSLIWKRFGNVPNYVEPFFGSGAVLLGRDTPAGTETVNDKDGFVANFWRAVAMDAASVWHYADEPVNECDLHAKHLWLVNNCSDLSERLMNDPDYFDPKIAGWWVWGLCSWIGDGWCSGNGPWVIGSNKIEKRGRESREDEAGIIRQLPHLGDAGQGIKRKLPHLGNAGQGIIRKLPHLGDAGRGINRQLPHLGNAGRGINRKLPHLGNAGPLTDLAIRLRSVRVCCGDWSRVCGPSPTFKLGITAVLMDPPYDASLRDKNCYVQDTEGLSAEVRKWCIENGSNKKMRIALCGYDGEHCMPSDWECVAWSTKGGYGSQGQGRGRMNKDRERIWFSPHCLKE